MTETARTTSFVIAAVLAAGAAWLGKPAESLTPAEMQSAKLGQPFFPEFKDPTEPTSIRVINFDDQKAVSRIFAVEKGKDDSESGELWRIPSHQNYPADGADRLAKTATSLIGIKREGYISGAENRHEEFGVVDPLEKDTTKLKGRGQRVTLSKGTQPVLDLIIGKAVRDRSGYRYVRHPEEKSVYVTKLTPDLSTKFADWVETNLLKLSRDDLSGIEIDNYSIAEAREGFGRIEPGEIAKLTRDKAFDPWQLDGLEDPEKEVDTTKTNELVNTLVDLRLTGIRPKPQGLNPDLTIDRNVVTKQAQLDLLLSDMSSRGFIAGPGKNEDDPPKLYSKLGELRLNTNKGLSYILRFGDVFTGSESEIESGAPAEKEAGGNADSKPDSEKEPEASTKQDSRYLLVSVAFDETLLGPKPEPPTPLEEVKAD
ncbi:MAG: DUF4340 domain-containing protein, partial [Planctomycetaceae bacterium]